MLLEDFRRTVLYASRNSLNCFLLRLLQVITTLQQGWDVITLYEIRHVCAISWAGDVTRNLTLNWSELELAEETFVRRRMRGGTQHARGKLAGDAMQAPKSASQRVDSCLS